MRTSRLVGLVVLALGPLIAPYVAGGQTPAKVPRVGIIHLSGHHKVVVDGLRQGLRELGLEEGKHLVLDIREIQGDLARVKKLPTMFHETSLVDNGALASYGHNYREIGRLSAKHVQRILAGTPPKDLPVENYDRIELALNLRTAREIGLTIPPSVRIRADKVIDP